VLKSKIHFNRM